MVQPVAGGSEPTFGEDKIEAPFNSHIIMLPLMVLLFCKRLSNQLSDELGCKASERHSTG
jgi:hypothetical protein